MKNQVDSGVREVNRSVAPWAPEQLGLWSDDNAKLTTSVLYQFNQTHEAVFEFILPPAVDCCFVEIDGQRIDLSTGPIAEVIEQNFITYLGEPGYVDLFYLSKSPYHPEIQASAASVPTYVTDPEKRKNWKRKSKANIFYDLGVFTISIYNFTVTYKR